MTRSSFHSDSYIDSLFREGLSFYESSQWEKAFEAFEGVLKKKPAHFEAIRLSALILLRQEKFTSSLLFLKKALEVEPKHSQCLRNLSWVLFNLGREQEALEVCKQRLRIEPESMDALSLRAQIQTRLGNFDDALATWTLLDQRLPQSSDIHNNMGVLWHHKGDFNKALQHYQWAQSWSPKDAKIAFNRAVCLEKLERYNEAVQSYQLATELDRQYKDAFFNLGILNIQLHEYKKALECFDRVLALDAQASLAYLNKAIALQKLKDLSGARLVLEQAKTIDPRNALIVFNLASVMQDQRELIASKQMYREALALDAQNLNAWCNLGDVCHDLQDLKGAMECYDKALTIEPSSVRAKYHLSLTYLLDAQFDKAWPLFESRREYENSYLSFQAELSSPVKPLWLGQSSLRGKRILVRGEQGLGDSIQFVRYVPALISQGAQVVLQVPKPLMALFRCIPGVFQLLSSDPSESEQEVIDQCELEVPMMSLPLALRSEWTQPLCSGPYLQASAATLEKWKKLLGPKTRSRVGLVWSGGLREEQPWTWAVNQRRNMALSAFEILEHSGLEFLSVQKGQQAQEELKALEAQSWRGPALLNWMDEVVDFEDTAGLMEQLDLLISVDTSCAHLAGAMGKPVWLLNRYDTCWRWQLHRSDSPWYPSMKIYRQSQLDDWTGVMEQVRVDLLEYFSLPHRESS